MPSYLAAGKIFLWYSPEHMTDLCTSNLHMNILILCDSNGFNLVTLFLLG